MRQQSLEVTWMRKLGAKLGIEFHRKWSTKAQCFKLSQVEAQRFKSETDPAVAQGSNRRCESSLSQNGQGQWLFPMVLGSGWKGRCPGRAWRDSDEGSHEALSGLGPFAAKSRGAVGFFGAWKAGDM